MPHCTYGFICHTPQQRIISKFPSLLPAILSAHHTLAAPGHKGERSRHHRPHQSPRASGEDKVNATGWLSDKSHSSDVEKYQEALGMAWKGLQAGLEARGGCGWWAGGRGMWLLGAERPYWRHFRVVSKASSFYQPNGCET